LGVLGDELADGRIAALREAIWMLNIGQGVSLMPVRRRSGIRLQPVYSSPQVTAWPAGGRQFH
jgi:hypothetical protein